MRRAQNLASSILGRALVPVLEGCAAASSPSSSATSISVQRRLLQVALYNTSSSGSSGRSRLFSAYVGRSTRVLSLGVAGVVSFSVAASSIVPDVYAKEPLASEYLPKDAVLYQYEACPFCNKVKVFFFSPCRWVDSELVHVLSPNIYRTASEALESFDYITSNGNFSFTEKITAKYAGAAAMYFVSKKLKKKYNITDERAALYNAAETWVDALNGRDFLGGSKPNLADLAVFGVLRPIRHLRSGRDMIENTRIGDWYTRMERAVGESTRIKA
ncbi:prostaglandin E synthase 2-like isoform X2 [Telopea speciosissima]|uniref:prostaglandin E synthase 2-like isoform X2 n=1 Tax=Telopea speciosissima TaxID=54955 RepID=UPI001CC34F70|nr:prostaglandin E synthase 2-like isoform X2 [Telopea speciosissima]